MLAARLAPARALARPVRLGLANLHRPGAPTPLMLVSVGLGLSTLAAVALIQGNMRQQILEQLPADAPSFFFVDIQNDQLPRFEAAGARRSRACEDMHQVPSLRARIVAVNGVPAEQVQATPDTALGAARRPRPDLCRHAAGGHAHRRRPVVAGRLRRPAAGLVRRRPRQGLGRRHRRHHPGQRAGPRHRPEDRQPARHRLADAVASTSSWSPVPACCQHAPHTHIATVRVADAGAGRRCCAP